VAGDVLVAGWHTKPGAQSAAEAQVAAHTGVSEDASQRKGAQESTGVQVPSAEAPFAREQTLHVSVDGQAVSQQTPSTQKPLAQSPGAEQDVVQARVAAFLSQTKGAHWRSAVQAPSAGAPLACAQVLQEPGASQAASQQTPSRHASLRHSTDPAHSAPPGCNWNTSAVARSWPPATRTRPSESGVAVCM
jgi:hypothetical protein